MQPLDGPRYRQLQDARSHTQGMIAYGIRFLYPRAHGGEKCALRFRV
jgi:hypothetical protein